MTQITKEYMAQQLDNENISDKTKQRINRYLELIIELETLSKEKRKLYDLIYNNLYYKNLSKEKVAEYFYKNRNKS